MQKFPGVTVLDPPNAIQQLRNRQSMLQDVADLNLPDCEGVVSIHISLVTCVFISSLFCVTMGGVPVEWLYLKTNSHVYFSTQL